MGYVVGNLWAGAFWGVVLAFVVGGVMKGFDIDSDVIKFSVCFVFFLVLFGTFMYDFLENVRGRMRRLNYILGIFSINIVNFVIFHLLTESEGVLWFNTMLFTLFIYLFFSNLAISAARFRDINSNPRLAWLLLIPFVNLLVLLALCFLPGTPGKNQYGDNPKLKGVEPPQPSHDNASNSSSD